MVYAYHRILFNFKKEVNSVILAIWMHLGTTMLSETGQSQKDKCYRIPHIGEPKIVKLTEAEQWLLREQWRVAAQQV